MRIKSLKDEDFVNYKKSSMFISSCYCDWKCCKDLGLDVCICQNAESYSIPIVDMSDDDIIERYLQNPITQAVVIGGFEPFLQFEEIYEFIRKFRKASEDDIVIYTGYYLEEKVKEICRLKEFKNIIVKFGRYIPNGEPYFNSVLGVELANKEQYVVRL